MSPTGQQITGPIALGIHWAHDSSAAICSPDGVICTIQEDRLNRIKHYYGFPCLAIEAVLRHSGLTAADIDLFAVSTNKVFYPTHANHFTVDLDGTCSAGAEAESLARTYKKLGFLRGTRRVIKNVLVSREQTRENILAGVEATWGEFAPRHWLRQEGFLRELGLLDERIAHYYIHHHRAHAASAFRLSGLAESCILSIDGKGDGVSAAILRGHPDGRMELLRESHKTDSLGAFYQAITESLGFIPADGEYKTMGLAALGEKGKGPNPFRGTVSVRDGVLHSTIKWQYRDYNQHNPDNRVPNPLSSVSHTVEFKKLLETHSREQFAYFAQEHFQDNMLDLARDALRISGTRSLVGAGGVMLNVKANSAIRDEVQPSHFFIFPDSADSGLSVGAAMEALYQVGSLDGPCRLTTPYLGHSYTRDEMEEWLQRYREKHGLKIADATHPQLARILAEGKVIGTFRDRLEFGPRALGNRSVLADPRSAAMKDRINLILKGRDWFVPFAPMVLEEDAHLYWDGATDYPYMTIAVEASSYAREAVPAVVHTDGTMRPQVVGPETNPWIHDLLLGFKEEAGVGVLINTSFNRHGLPIVGSPEDALHHLVKGWVDGLVLGPWYVERP